MRHCWNRMCGGPEYWYCEDGDKLEPCPACGYPCSNEEPTHDLSAAESADVMFRAERKTK